MSETTSEAVVEAPVEAEAPAEAQPRDEHGKFAKKGDDDEGAPPAPAEKLTGKVPVPPHLHLVSAGVSWACRLYCRIALIKSRIVP